MRAAGYYRYHRGPYHHHHHHHHHRHCRKLLTILGRLVHSHEGGGENDDDVVVLLLQILSPRSILSDATAAAAVVASALQQQKIPFRTPYHILAAAAGAGARKQPLPSATYIAYRLCSLATYCRWRSPTWPALTLGYRPRTGGLIHSLPTLPSGTAASRPRPRV